MMNESYFVLREKCPVCRSAHGKELYSASFTEPPISTYLKNFYYPYPGVEFDYLKGFDYVLDECGNCGLIYQRWVPNPLVMNRLYEQWIDQEGAFNQSIKSHKIEYYMHLARELELVIQHFEVKPGELELLDFGMGWGEWCRMAHAYGCSAYGTELSEARINYARKFGVSVLTWEEISGHQFDFINTEQVFEHLSNPLDTMQYLSRSLKTGGIIKVSVPYGRDIRRRMAIMDWSAPKDSRNSLNLIAPLEHINYFSSNSLARLAQLAGLLPVSMRARIRADRRLLDLTLRDMVHPVYRWVIQSKYVQMSGSVTLFFQRG